MGNIQSIDMSIQYIKLYEKFNVLKNQNVLKSTIPKECYIHIEHYNLDNVKYVDLRDNCPPIYDQGKLGSCTANAIAAAFEYDEIE